MRLRTASTLSLQTIENEIRKGKFLWKCFCVMRWKSLPISIFERITFLMLCSSVRDSFYLHKTTTLLARLYCSCILLSLEWLYWYRKLEVKIEIFTLFNFVLQGTITANFQIEAKYSSVSFEQSWTCWFYFSFKNTFYIIYLERKWYSSLQEVKISVRFHYIDILANKL